MSPESKPVIDSSRVRAFVDTSRKLTEVLRKALGDFAKHPKPELENYADIWKTRVIPTLETDLDQLEEASRRFDRGASDPVLFCASDKMSLSKDLDNFSLDWTTAENSQAIQEAIAEVVQVAREIYDLANPRPQ